MSHYAHPAFANKPYGTASAGSPSPPQRDAAGHSAHLPLGGGRRSPTPGAGPPPLPGKDSVAPPTQHSSTASLTASASGSHLGFGSGSASADYLTAFLSTPSYLQPRSNDASTAAMPTAGLSAASAGGRGEDYRANAGRSIGGDSTIYFGEDGTLLGTAADAAKSDGEAPKSERISALADSLGSGLGIGLGLDKDKAEGSRSRTLLAAGSTSSPLSADVRTPPSAYPAGSAGATAMQDSVSIGTTTIASLRREDSASTTASRSPPARRHQTSQSQPAAYNSSQRDEHELQQQYAGLRRPPGIGAAGGVTLPSAAVTTSAGSAPGAGASSSTLHLRNKSSVGSFGLMGASSSNMHLPASGAAGVSNPNFVFAPPRSPGTPTAGRAAIRAPPLSAAGRLKAFRFGLGSKQTKSPAAATTAEGLAAPTGKHGLSGKSVSSRPSHAATGQSTGSALQIAKDTYFWWLDALWTTSWVSRAFLALILTEAAIDISIESVLLARYNEQKAVLTDVAKQRALPVFLIVFGLAHVYQFVLAVDAVVNKNTILVIGMVLFNGCMLIYAGIQIGEIRDVLGSGVIPGRGQIVPVGVLTGAIPVVVGIAEAAIIVIAWYLWKEFGWRIYKQIGADRGLKKRYLQYQIYVALLKFDFFVFCAFCLQLVLIVLEKTDAEFIITTIAPVFSLAILVFAWWAVRKENKLGMYAFMVGLLGALVYFIYKLYRIWQSKLGAYKEVYKSLTIFSLLSLALLLVSFFMTIRCLLNFGRGLKAAIAKISMTRHLGHGRMQSSGNIMAPYAGKGDLPLVGGRDAYLHHRLSID